MEHFNCFKCGGSELSYQKYVKYVDKVIIHPDDHIEHHQQKIDETDVIGAEHYYICACCGMPPMFRGDYITTEDELVEYLGMTLEERAEMLAEYFTMDEELAQQIEECRIDEEEQIEEIDETEPNQREDMTDEEDE